MHAGFQSHGRRPDPPLSFSLHTCHICTTRVRPSTARLLSVQRQCIHIVSIYYIILLCTPIHPIPSNQHTNPPNPQSTPPTTPIHQPPSPRLRQHRRRLLQIGLPQVRKPRHCRAVDHTVVPCPGNGHDARRHHRRRLPALGAAAAAAAAEAVCVGGGLGVNWWWVGAVACVSGERSREAGGGVSLCVGVRRGLTAAASQSAHHHHQNKYKYIHAYNGNQSVCASHNIF